MNTITTMGLASIAMLGVLGVVQGTARAATDCELEVRGSQLRLLASCTTDETIFVDEGMTLDGNGYVITAVDPPSGVFQGAVVQNAGSVMHVRRLGLDSSELAAQCNPAEPDLRLRGIFFLDASGSVTDSEIANISQASGCQEGNAIEARSGTNATTLRLVGNRITGYQKTGIGLFGSVSAQIMFNHVEGYGSTDRIAQNGIQVSFGARATIRWNTVINNLYAPQTAASTGIFLWEAGTGCSVGLNAVRNNDVGIYLLDTQGARVTFNDIQDSTFTSIFEDGEGDNTIQRNRCSSAGTRVECEP